MTRIHDLSGYTAKQAHTVLELLSKKHFTENKIKMIPTFEYAGFLWLGDYDVIVKNFVINNLGGDFYVYIQNNCPRLEKVIAQQIELYRNDISMPSHRIARIILRKIRKLNLRKEIKSKK